MKTTYKPNPKQQSNSEKKPNWFWQILGGEFLIMPQVKNWYPYILLLFVMIGTAVVSEKYIKEKQKIIKEKEIEYKEEITKLKKNNQFIPYEQNQELIQLLEEQGFVKNNEVMYKIVVEK